MFNKNQVILTHKITQIKILVLFLKLQFSDNFELKNWKISTFYKNVFLNHTKMFLK